MLGFDGITCRLAGGGAGAPGRADRLVRFLLDMGISIHLIPELRSDGHEAGAALFVLKTTTHTNHRILAELLGG